MPPAITTPKALALARLPCVLTVTPDRPEVYTALADRKGWNLIWGASMAAGASPRERMAGPAYWPKAGRTKTRVNSARAGFNRVPPLGQAAIQSLTRLCGACQAAGCLERVAEYYDYCAPRESSMALTVWKMMDVSRRKDMFLM